MGLWSFSWKRVAWLFYSLTAVWFYLAGAIGALGFEALVFLASPALVLLLSYIFRPFLMLSELYILTADPEMQLLAKQGDFETLERKLGEKRLLKALNVVCVVLLYCSFLFLMIVFLAQVSNAGLNLGLAVLLHGASAALLILLLLSPVLDATFPRYNLISYLAIPLRKNHDLLRNFREEQLSEYVDEIIEHLKKVPVYRGRIESRLARACASYIALFLRNEIFDKETRLNYLFQLYDALYALDESLLYRTIREIDEDLKKTPELKDIRDGYVSMLGAIEREETFERLLLKLSHTPFERQTRWLFELSPDAFRLVFIIVTSIVAVLLALLKVPVTWW